MAGFAKTSLAIRSSWSSSLCLFFRTPLATGSKITTLRLSGRKGIAVYTSLVSPTISTVAVLIRLNMASISIVTSTASLRDRFSTTVRLFLTQKSRCTFHIRLVNRRLGLRLLHRTLDLDENHLFGFI